MNVLEKCRWLPRWVSHLGCIKGCLDFLHTDISEAWLLVGTGHAFVMNLHKEVCPSGPTAWKTEKLFQLGRNLGYTIDGVFGFKDAEDIGEKRKHAFDLACGAVDSGVPCYSWELEMPEYYVVYGYDQVGYYYSGPMCDEGKGPKPWNELADTGIGVLEMYRVSPGEPADDRIAVRDALEFAVAHAEDTKEWVHNDYGSGLQGYDNWISALPDGNPVQRGCMARMPPERQGLSQRSERAIGCCIGSARACRSGRRRRSLAHIRNR